MNWLASIGSLTIGKLSSFGRATLMLFGAIVAKPQVIKNVPLTIKQIYAVGVQSLLIVVVSGLLWCRRKFRSNGRFILIT